MRTCYAKVLTIDCGIVVSAPAVYLVIVYTVHEVSLSD
jgi:hypothetical protein